MNRGTGDAQAIVALDAIKKAFAHRNPPCVLTDSMQLTEGECADVMAFDGMDWRDVTVEQVERCADAVFWFSPEAFCYYLPGILAAGLKSRRSDLSAYDSLIGSLDRSPAPDHWDDFFLPRWPLLSGPEIDAVTAWVRWLEIVEPDQVFENTYQRTRDTLDLLKAVTEGTAPTDSSAGGPKGD
jgi:hypothetical protein